MAVLGGLACMANTLLFSIQAQAPSYVYISSASVLSHTSTEIKLYLDISRNRN
jgi:hypothetical protein